MRAQKHYIITLLIGQLQECQVTHKVWYVHLLIIGFDGRDRGWSFICGFALSLSDWCLVCLRRGRRRGRSFIRDGRGSNIGNGGSIAIFFLLLGNFLCTSFSLPHFLQHGLDALTLSDLHLVESTHQQN